VSALLALLTAGIAESFHGGATLGSSLESVVPGSTFEVGIRISLDPGWHTYWQNPGDAGIPPKITWSLPAGWKASEVQWPTPHKLISPEVVSFGYEREALLLVRLTAPKSVRLGSSVALKAKVDWLVCQDGCIPATASVQAPIKIALKSKPDPVWYSKIQSAAQNLPKMASPGSVSATIAGSDIVMTFGKPVGGSLTFYPADPVVEPSAPQTLGSAGVHSTLTLKISQFAPASVPRLRGLLVSERGASLSSEIVDIPLRRRNL
jgi:thiol:disulfide interchange protein DsbD